jgi:hypothetical protein
MAPVEEEPKEFTEERVKIREHRLDTLLGWGLPLPAARRLMRAEYVPLYDVYRMKEKGASLDQILRCLL